MFMPFQETGYEVRFQVFGIPVTVHPFFWLVALILVGSAAAQTPDGQPILNVLGAVGIVFGSILVHELGHSAAMAWYRIPSRIVLYAMGGMAIPLGSGISGSRRGMWDQVMISFAGPLAQFILLAPLIVIAVLVEIPRNDVLSLATMLNIGIFCNLFWPVLNLLPVLPLDGGRICQGFARMIQGHYRGDITALWISVICGAVLIVLAFQYNFVFFAVFLIFMTIQNFQELQQGPRRW